MFRCWVSLFCNGFTLGRTAQATLVPIWIRVSLCMRKALLGFFLCIFSSLTCLKKPVFSKRDLLRCKVTARLYWDLLTNGRYQPQISNHGRACAQALLHYVPGPCPGPESGWQWSTTSLPSIKTNLWSYGQWRVTSEWAMFIRVRNIALLPLHLRLQDPPPNKDGGHQSEPILWSKSCLLQLPFLTLLQLPQNILQPRWLLVTWLSWSRSCPYRLHEFFHRWRIQEWHPPLPLLHCRPLSKQLHSCLRFHLHPLPSPSSCHLPSLQQLLPLHTPTPHPKTSNIKERQRALNAQMPSTKKELYLNLKYFLWVHLMFLGFNHSPSFAGSCMYFVVGNLLWVIYQILYVKNVILASADLASVARGATAHAVDLFGGLPMVWKECLQLRKSIWVCSSKFKNSLEFKAIHAQYDSTGELLTLEPDSGRDRLVLLDEPESEGTDPQLHLGGLVLQPPHDQNGDDGENLQ